jgi:hypothetical protein
MISRIYSLRRIERRLNKIAIFDGDDDYVILHNLQICLGSINLPTEQNLTMITPM